MTSPMYIGEVAPASIRGNLVVMNTAMITGGQLVASVVAGLFSGDTENGWRYMLGLAGRSSKQFLLKFCSSVKEGKELHVYCCSR